MEMESQHGNFQGSNSDAVEITIEDIIGDDEENKHEGNVEFINTLPTEMLSCQTSTLKIKAEPQNEYILNGEEVTNDSFIMKAKIKEECTNSDAYQDENSNWTSLVPQEMDIELKTEEYSETSNNSDHFSEIYIKTEDNIVNYLNEVDLALFNQQKKCAINKKETSSDVPEETKKTEDNISPYECNLCDYKSFSKTSFAYHSTMRHSILQDDYSKLIWYYCTKCNYKSRQKGHLRRHYLTHQNVDDVKVFTCGICDYKFKQKCTLRRHIYNVHTDHTIQSESISTDNVSRTFKCSQCSYSTMKKGLLLSHLDKHKDTREVMSLFICDICSFSTKYRRNLRVHLETHKDSPELQIFECKLCKFKTRLGYCLKRHFLSKKHLRVTGKLEEYCPRSMKLSRESDS